MVIRILFLIALILAIRVETSFAQLYNDGYTERFEIVSKLPERVIDFNAKNVKLIKKEVGYTGEVIISKFELKGVYGYTNITDNYIVIANPRGEYWSLLRTILHEIGHMKQKQINIRKYTQRVYDKTYRHISTWEYRWEEEFAEDYTIYTLSTKYPEVMNNFNITKRTKEAYNGKRVGAFFIRYLK